MTALSEIVDLLNEIAEDSSTTKNIKSKIGAISAILSAEGDLPLKKNKASHELDELASNPDIDSYTRTQLLGIVGALENVSD